MQSYRIQQAALQGYDDSVYKFAPLNWTQHNPIQPQAMAHDRYFYDVTAGTYTVDKYLADVRIRYGGGDLLLFLPNHPKIGVDSHKHDPFKPAVPALPHGSKTNNADFHIDGGTLAA